MTSHRAFAFVLLTLTACSAASESPDAVSESDLSSATTPAAPTGLMTRSGAPPGAPLESVVKGAVALLKWSDIQPTANGAPDFSSLDTALRNLNNVGVTNVKVRILSGGDAPGWVKRLGSPPSHFYNGVVTSIDCSEPAQGSENYGGVAAVNPQGPVSACVPFFWTAAYMTAYQTLMTDLKAQLASDPKYNVVSTIVDSACMAIYAEVFYRGQGDADTNQTLFDAGLNHQADIACQENAIGVHKSVFGATRRTSVAINDWDIVQGTEGPNHDYRQKIWYDGGTTWATYEFAEWARQQLTFNGHELLEVQNNGLHSTGASCPAGGTGTTSYWCYISLYTGSRGFQTQTYVDNATLMADLNNGLALNAQFIELPNGMKDSDWPQMGCVNKHLLKGNSSSCP